MPGGVIVFLLQWVQGLQAFMWSETEVTDNSSASSSIRLSRVIRRAGNKVSHRTAAMAIGVERVMHAKHIRGLFPDRGDEEDRLAAR